MKKLKWYIVNKEYVKYLKLFDNKVENIDYDKNIKPYIGIVLNIDSFKYYVPISSPKEKHYKMEEDIDFIKIIDKKGSILGVLNLNNMIPILDSEIEELKYDEIDEIKTFNNEREKQLYLMLLRLEIKIMNGKVEKILRNASKLYDLKGKKPKSKIAKRCCDFKKLEGKAIEYNKG